MSKIEIEHEKESKVGVDAAALKPKKNQTDKAEIANLKAEVERLQKELAALDEQRLRALADKQNLLERSRKEVRDAQDYSIRNFAKDLLSVFDILEQSIDSITQDERTPSTLSEGLQMTLDMLFKTLGQHHIEVISPEGERFDPNLHDAISMEVSDSVEAKTIVRVIQKGYRIKDRLLRPAMVVVAKEK